MTIFIWKWLIMDIRGNRKVRKIEKIFEMTVVIDREYMGEIKLISWTI